MTKDEMRGILAKHLSQYRAWSYAQLAERVERGPSLIAHDCFEHVEGTASDGTEY